MQICARSALPLGKVRYKDEGAPCLLWQEEPNTLEVAFATPRTAITPGQAVVLYEGEDVLGGAWIDTVDPARNNR